MKGPPDPKEEGVVRAATPTTPERDSPVERRTKTFRRNYSLACESVNPGSPVADARGAERSTGDPDALTEAEIKFLEICIQRTGEKLPDDLHAQRRRYRELLYQQSHRIAQDLESEGVKAYGSSKLTLVGLCSGKTLEIPDFRNIVFIPSVAQRKRNGLLKHLEYFLQEHPFSRMWVFTSGIRAHLADVRGRIQDLHRRLSKLNAEPFMKIAGASLVFRSTELGEVERNPIGEATFHVHAHTIIHLSRKLPKDEWSLLLKNVRSWWKNHFSDSKRIQMARETCKYVVKPGDLDVLSGPELARLHEQTFRLHLVQSLGLLREQRKFVTDNRKKVIRHPEKLGGKWELVDSWEPTKSKASDKALPRFEESELEDWVLCTLPPSFAVSKKAEPLAVILNYNGARLPKNRKVRAIREACDGLFNDNGN